MWHEPDSLPINVGEATEIALDVGEVDGRVGPRQPAVDAEHRARGGQPALFLLDELLSGTNSHDRKIGAEGIVETLLRRGSIGLVTTHDLALAAIAERPENLAVNVHFEDQIIDGRIQFDYRMKPGVVKTSKALALMRAVGLEV